MVATHQTITISPLGTRAPYGTGRDSKLVPLRNDDGSSVMKDLPADASRNETKRSDLRLYELQEPAMAGAMDGGGGFGWQGQRSTAASTVVYFFHHAAAAVYAAAATRLRALG